MRVNLYTRDDGFVASFVIPPFNSEPDVILWGMRVFATAGLDSAEPREYRYVEAFCYAVLSNQQV